MEAMIKVLSDLGVDLQAKEHTGYKFKAGSMMDLNVDVWQAGKRQFIAISHYGEQNGDAMADPDIECEISEKLNLRTGQIEKTLYPVHYQNDYLGIFQKIREYNGAQIKYSPSRTKDVRVFLTQWAKNIKAQGYKKEVLAVKA